MRILQAVFSDNFLFTVIHSRDAENSILKEYAKNNTKMKTLYFIFLFSILVFYSCKKSESPEYSIIGKWYIDSIQLANTPVYSTIYKNAGENYYYDFNADGKLYTYWLNNSFDTIPNYNWVKPATGNSYVKFPPLYGGTAADTILNLTEHKLTLTAPQGGKSIIYFTR